jgi:hypothetical protein
MMDIADFKNNFFEFKRLEIGRGRVPCTSLPNPAKCRLSDSVCTFRVLNDSPERCGPKMDGTLKDR